MWPGWFPLQPQAEKTEILNRNLDWADAKIIGGKLRLADSPTKSWKRWSISSKQWRRANQQTMRIGKTVKTGTIALQDHVIQLQCLVPPKVVASYMTFRVIMWVNAKAVPIVWRCERKGWLRRKVDEWSQRCGRGPTTNAKFSQGQRFHALHVWV